MTQPKAITILGSYSFTIFLTIAGISKAPGTFLYKDFLHLYYLLLEQLRQPFIKPSVISRLNSLFTIAITI